MSCAMSPSTALSRDSRRGVSRWLGYALAVLGLLVIFALISRAGPFAVLHAISRVGAGFLLILLAPIVGMVLHCWGWLVLLPRAARPTPTIALCAYVAAQAGDELGAGVAGEPLKLLVACKAFRTRAAVALAVDNASQVTALGGFMLAASCTLLVMVPVPRSGAHVLLAFAGTLLAGLGVLLPLLVAGVIRRAPCLRSYGWSIRLAHTLNATRVFMRRRPGKVFGSVLLHGLGKAWIVAEMALALALLGAMPSAALWLAPMSVLGSLLGTMIPGQAGAVEAALAMGGAVAGVDPATVMALAVLRRLRTGLWIVVGALLVRKLFEPARVPECSLPTAEQARIQAPQEAGRQGQCAPTIFTLGRTSQLGKGGSHPLREDIGRTGDTS